MSDVSMEVAQEHIGLVTLHRPPNNYFDTELLRQLASAYEELAESDWCRVIVLAAEGKHFCAGLDFAGNGGQDIADLYRNALRIFAAPLPVVAAVLGAAVGGGLGLALSADFRLASPESRFSANFARLGFHHGFALTVTLPKVVGSQSAADLLLTGRRVGGVDALALGLCDQLVDEDQLINGALAYAASIAASGPLAVRAIRATLRQDLVEQVRLAMDHECAVQERLRSTADFAEGIRASAQRRDPNFTGQ
jgi:enoyl-CoA hydratase/carnithine racemase